MATYTATTYSAQPKFNLHGGISPVGGTVMLPAASSNGDVVFLARIPHGAQIIDFWEDHTTGATTQVLDFGFAKGGTDGGGASFSALVSGGAQATRNRLGVLGYPAVVSVSDNDALRWGILAAKVVSGSGTTSLKISFNVMYRTDNVG